METRVTIGIADMQLLQNEGTLITYALGSCIGICLYDPVLKLGALLHIMLPLNMEAGRKNPLKYADTGMVEMLRQLEARGASKARMVAKIAGGAKMFEVSGGALGNIGQRNIESVRIQLKKHGIRLHNEDVGGTVARTMMMDVATGTVSVRSYGRPEVIM